MQLNLVRSCVLEEFEFIGIFNLSVFAFSKPEEILSQKSADIPQVSGLYCFVRTEYIFAALRKNYVDAVAGHEYMLRVFINESDNKYRLLDESLLLSKLGIAFAKDNNSALPEKLRATLYDMKNDGTLAKIAVIRT